MRAESKFHSAPFKSVTTFPARGIDELQGFRATFRKEVRKCGRKPKMNGRAQKVSPRKRGREYVTGRQISKVGAHTAAAPVFSRLAYLLILTGCEPSAQKVQSWLIVLGFRDALKAELRRSFCAGVGSLRDDEPLLIDDPAYDFFQPAA